jgi:transporter family protein
MAFAGVTSVVAKMGLAGISGELGLSIRTAFVAAFVLLFALLSVPRQELAALNRQNLFWLGVSGVTTTASWIFYYKALKLGDVATIALIDKGSILVSIALAALVLHEQITLRVVSGGALILAGLLIVSRK